MGRGIRCRSCFNYNLSFDPVASTATGSPGWLRSVKAACLHNSVIFCSELKVDLDKQGRKTRGIKANVP